MFRALAVAAVLVVLSVGSVAHGADEWADGWWSLYGKVPHGAERLTNTAAESGYLGDAYGKVVFDGNGQTSSTQGFHWNNDDRGGIASGQGYRPAEKLDDPLPEDSWLEVLGW